VYKLPPGSHSQQVNSSPQLIFGLRIRSLRAAAGLTQEDLAARCGLFRTYMSRIETGAANPTLTMIHALAQSLGVDVCDLFKDEEIRIRNQQGIKLSRGRVSR
jgi:transcriptional regulator with XRE-family HTH domain